MGYRGKLMVEHTGIELPNELVKKYEKDYYIAKDENGKAYVNISSKNETKGHYEILSDLQDLLKGNSFYVDCGWTMDTVWYRNSNHSRSPFTLYTLEKITKFPELGITTRHFA